MIQKIKKIMQNKKHRNIAALCILCVIIAGGSMWFLFGKNDPDSDGNNPDDLFDLDDAQVPLSNAPRKISAGDTVVVNVFADEMYDVYGYQFDIHFDKDFIEYRKRLFSDIDQITTIFATDKEWYLLVGATMIGNAKGYSGQAVPVCRVEFVALTDFELNTDLSSDHIALSGVNVVTGDLQYLENIEGWTTTMTVR